MAPEASPRGAGGAHVTTQVNATEIQRFFAQLYPAVEDGWLVLSYPDPTRLTPQGKPTLLSDWFDLSKTTWQAIDRAAQRRAKKSNVYFGVVLQRPTCDPGQFKRSKNSTAYIVPGLWFDLDLAYGQHVASTLPVTDAEARDFLASLPSQPTLIVHSGGGMYPYWLFREPYIITNDAEHQAITQLVKRFAYTLTTAGKERGWTLDSLGDLARVLRPPGTVNHKYGKRVEVIHESGVRYNPSEFDSLLILPTPARTTHTGTAVAGQPDLVAIAEHYGTVFAQKSQTELAGTHPIHGSSTGDNFHVNPSKGCWHCWRHGTGGDALALIAVCEGLLDCEKAVSGALRGDLFKRVVAIANETFQAEIRLGAQQRNGSAPGPEPPDPYACPELPAYATTDAQSAAEASLFLDDYTSFSRQWAPRAYEGFHEAVALFVLATIAARRIKIELGPRGMYTSLYMALTARTTIFTKTTAADIGIALLDAAGLISLLADDDATPQAFLHSLSLSVPGNYKDMPADEQGHTRLQLAFAAQRGWFYEEWGQHLEAMMQKNSFMAGFRGILRRFDDHKLRYVYRTISRGRDIIHKPYLTILANVTPADLQPFVKARSPLWRDGYIARVAFVAPDTTDGSEDEFPEGRLTFPGYFMTSLQSWHKRLGIPSCSITPQTDNKGNATGTYAVQVSPLPEKTYTLSPAVRKAFYAYDRAMRALTRQRKDENLDGSYGRFPIKALRIAGLLASIHDDGDRYTIWPAQWWRGQQIAEHWRRDLHRLMQQVHITPDLSQNAKAERRVIDVLRQRGPLTIRKINRWTKLPYADLTQHCITLVAAQVLVEEKTPRATKYRLPEEETC